MSAIKKITTFISQKRLPIICGAASAGLFVFSMHFFVNYSLRTDLIPFLDTPLKNTIVFSIFEVAFLAALGEFAANVGKFSFANYAVTTFFAALACYVITPPLEIFTCLDLSDANYVANALNASYSAWWIVYLIVYACSLVCGLLINRKNIFAVKVS